MNYDGVSIAFELITDELKRVADDISNQGSLAFKEKRFDDAERLSLTGKNLHSFVEKVTRLLEEWQGRIDVNVRRKIQIKKIQKFRIVRPQVKSPRTKLRVKFKTGKVIEEYYAADTFALAIKEIGMDNVEHLGLKVRGVPLVGNQKSKEYKQRLLDKRLICVHSSTEEKKEMLETIAKRLGTDLVVDIIP